MDSHILNKLQKLIDKEGRSCLLPQNLPEDILNRIESEAVAMEEERDNPPTSLILLAVLTLKDASIMECSGTIEFSTEELMDYFFVYSSSVRLEILRRNGKIIIEESSLPTLDNILNGNRMMNISQMSE